jgi:hypothetical protein
MAVTDEVRSHPDAADCVDAAAAAAASSDITAYIPTHFQRPHLHRYYQKNTNLSASTDFIQSRQYSSSARKATVKEEEPDNTSNSASPHFLFIQ